MSAYNELIKNFEKIRAYMREFYVFGFKSRDGYSKKSARSYDDERRRIESWLGDYMSFVRTSEGKNVFLSIDSRSTSHNPFFKALKTKSFTNGDITLHFILFDILHSEDVVLSLSEIIERIDGEYLSQFDSPMVFDESTVRKKLKEYCNEGIIVCEKRGRSTAYRRASSPPLPSSHEVLHFFSEVSPCGVIGSFLLDKYGEHKDVLSFKHHYITGAVDSGVTELLLCAMRERRAVTVYNLGRRDDEPRRIRIVPLRIFISSQSGRQFLIAYNPEQNRVRSLRIDYLSSVKLEDTVPRFCELRSYLDSMQKHTWGVITSSTFRHMDKTERVEFTVRAAPWEGHIVNRLMRERRIGMVESLGDGRYRFCADVYDSGELIPWIRTFICRLESVKFSNKLAEAKLRGDLHEMYRMYGIGEEDGI